MRFVAFLLLSASLQAAVTGTVINRTTGQPQAGATVALNKLATRLRAESGANESEQAQHTLLAADIKRFLERPAETSRIMPAPSAPPGAPIGDMPMDWLAAAPW